MQNLMLVLVEVLVIRGVEEEMGSCGSRVAVMGGRVVPMWKEE